MTGPPVDPRTGPLAARLRRAGCVFAEEEAALLLDDGPTESVLEDRAARRCAGEPLEQVLGWAAFAGLRVAVAPGVFVPRRRSELLAREAAARAARAHDAALARGSRAVVVDLCCGTGALALVVATRVPGAEVHAADLDPAAAACAAHNLRGVEGAAAECRVHTGDLFDALPRGLRGRVDVLVVNAPYVPRDEVALMPPEARDHEPLVALDGGADGLEVHRRVASGARGWLSPGGVLLVETSARQAAGTETACRAGGTAAGHRARRRARGRRRRRAGLAWGQAPRPAGHTPREDQRPVAPADPARSTPSAPDVPPSPGGGARG